MDEIIPIPVVEIRDGKPVTTSLQVAEYFGKKHLHVMRDIRNIIKKVPNFALLHFKLCQESKFVGNIIRSMPHYEITFDGLALLAMGYTGLNATQRKVAYLNEFRRVTNLLLDTHQILTD